MPATSVIFLGAKPIGVQCLQHLLAKAQELDILIAGVLTKERDTGVAAFARQNSLLIIPELDAMPICDVLISVQYHQILKPIHMARARRLAVNLHMAPLPEYRGCNQFSFAILDGRETFGTTLHCIDKGIDSGDILFEKRFSIPENCWVEELHHLTEHASLELFKESLPQLINGAVNPIPQETLIASRGTVLHFRKEIETIKHIDLSWDAERIGRHIRATYMPGFEPPYAFVGGAKVYFTREGAWQ